MANARTNGLLAVVALICGLAANALADANVNLTADVRAKHTAGLCGEPTITGTGHASYPYAKAFDGISTDESANRWLSAGDGNPASAWAQYVAPADYAPGMTFALSGYKVHRLFNSGTFDFPRSPKKWEILGVLPDGSTEVVATQTYTWGSANTDDVRIQTFAVGTDYKYRGFRFHSLETSSNDSVRFGLLEVEFFVSWADEDDGILTVASTLPIASDFSPAPSTTVWEDTACTAPDVVTYDNLPYNLAGYTLEKWTDGGWTGGNVTNVANRYDFSTETTKGAYRLTWCYVMLAYNLVPTMRAAGIEPTIEGPTAGGDWPVANVFDGITHSNNPGGTADKKLRWLCKKNDGPYVRISIGDYFRGSFAIVPVAYRVWRLYDTDQGYERAPTAWTLKGINTYDGTEVTLDTVSGISWSQGGSDGVRVRMIALDDVPEGDFRTFIFTPTATQQPNDYTGLFELEIFVKEGQKFSNALTVASAGDISLDCSPAVGNFLAERGTCTRTSKGYLGTSRYRPAGYKLYRLDGATWTEIASDPTADTYEWNGTGGTLKLEWQWGEVDGYMVDVASYGQETFTFSPASDSRGFFDIGARTTVTPNAQTDPASTFREWVGDVTTGCETAVPLPLTVNGPLAIRGEFTRTWKFIPETDEAKAGILTDGNWRFRTEKDTLAVLSGYDYARDMNLPAGSYKAGQGVLDMSTLPSDTGRFLSVIRQGAVTNRTGMTGLILPQGLARIGAASFSGSEDLEFIEMPDSVLVCDSGSGSDGAGGAFGNCAALTRVRLSDGLISLGHQTFGLCSNLVTVVPFLPQSLTYLGSAFQNCTSLAGTPDISCVSELANGCFQGCVGIVGDYDLTGKAITSGGYGPFMETGITSARGVGALPTRVFYRCAALTNVSCTAGITEISERAFAACAALAVVSAADDFAKVNTIGFGAFSGCGTDVAIPQRWPAVQHIDTSAFYGMVLNPNRRLEFPSVTSLKNDASCFDLANINTVDFRGSTFTIIPVNAFKPQTSPIGIMNLILPESVTTLKENALSIVTGRHDIRFCGPPPTSIDPNAFRGSDKYKELYIYVPQDPGILSAWMADADFVALSDIEDVETKDGWEAIKNNRHLVGAWRQKWCFTWNPTPKQGIMIILQ